MLKPVRGEKRFAPWPLRGMILPLGIIPRQLTAMDRSGERWRQPGRAGCARYPQAAVDMRATCEDAKYALVIVEVRNVPEKLHRELKARAALAGLSPSGYLLDRVRRLIERPTPDETRRRISQRSSEPVSEALAKAVRAERDSR